MRDPEHRAGTEMDLFARHYGLSPAEVRFSRALARGQTLADHCAARQVTRNTAHSQLSSIFQKTGVPRQVALVRLMMAFGVGA